METILVLSAVQREQQYLNVGKSGSNLKLGVCGVGPVDAGIQTAKLISVLKPTQVWFIGTAGVYPDRYLSPGDVVIGSEFLFGDTGLSAGTSYVPEIQMMKSEPVTLCLEPTFPFKVKNGKILTVPSITKSEKSAVELRDHFGADAEHLEVFSVWRACNLFHIPFSAVLGISNIVGPEAHEQWKLWQDPAVKHASSVFEFLSS